MRKIRWLFVIVLAMSEAAMAQSHGRLRYNFGSESKSGYLPVSVQDVYNSNAGFGWEPGANLTAAKSFITSEKPFYFSVALPEGNYNVMVVLGDPAGKSTTTVKAELRRLMLENVHTDMGQIVERSFTVNIRTPRISPGEEVILKPREKTTEAWAWDEKLTLEFSGERPCVDSLEISPADVPTVYLLGDSTVCDQPQEPWNSWGQMLTRFLKPGVAVFQPGGIWGNGG